MARRYAIHIHATFGPHEVRILAEAEGYAMVRRKGCMPYVASVKELRLLDESLPATPPPTEGEA